MKGVLYYFQLFINANNYNLKCEKNYQLYFFVNGLLKFKYSSLRIYCIFLYIFRVNEIQRGPAAFKRCVDAPVGIYAGVAFFYLEACLREDHANMEKAGVASLNNEQNFITASMNTYLESDL